MATDRRKPIPFLVIETAKTEYRALKMLKGDSRKAVRRFGSELEVYTVGVEAVSPLRLNPFEIPPGSSLEEHIETLVVCFEASMPLFGPLPALLREGLDRMYEKYPDPNDPPVMADLMAAVECVLAEKHYSDRIGPDIRAALDVRLGILTHGLIGRIFQCKRSTPSIPHLMATQSIHELDRLPREAASLYTFFLLTWIRQYVKSLEPQQRVRFVIVIEEAHNLVGRSTDTTPGEDAVDTKAHAAEFVCRMLAELRALGVALVIVDQLPSTVAPEVVKNTGSKLTFRLVANQDRTDLGGAMLFGDTEFEEVARLRTGEAFIFTEGYYSPRRIKASNLHAALNLTTPPINERLVPYIQDDDWFREAAICRRSVELADLRGHVDAFDSLRLDIVRRIAQLIARRVHILATVRQAESQRTRLLQLQRDAEASRRKLVSAFETVQRRPYRMLLGPKNVLERDDGGIEELRGVLARRFENVIKPDTQACIEKIDSLIAECRQSK